MKTPLNLISQRIIELHYMIIENERLIDLYSFRAGWSMKTQMLVHELSDETAMFRDDLTDALTAFGNAHSGCSEGDDEDDANDYWNNI